MWFLNLSGGIDKLFLAGLCPGAIRSLLANNTGPRPWYGYQALQTNFGFAVNAYSKRIGLDARKRGSHLSYDVGFPLELAKRELALVGVLDLVHQIGIRLNRDRLAVADRVLQFGRLGP